MKQVYRIQEEGSLNMHGQLCIGGHYYRVDTNKLESVDLILRTSHNLEPEEVEERDRRNGWDRRLKQRTVV